MIYTTTTNRLALRCDRPGCGATYHPRREARNRDELRAWANANAGWYACVTPGAGAEARDFCRAACLRLAGTLSC